MNLNLDEVLTPKLPRSMQMGIGLIGCGNVARHAHLPAYRKYGYRVVAAASRRRSSTDALADQFAIPKRYDNWRDLVDDRDVQVIDLTLPFDEQRLPILEAAAAAGKHVMLQKPMAHSWEAAQRMVQIAAQGRIILAINQNARWCPQYRAAKALIDRDMIGRPTFAIHVMLNNQAHDADFARQWYGQQQRFQLMEYTVHHLDLMRFWLGRQPTRLRASILRKPGLATRGEMTASVQLSFGDDLMAVVTDDNASHPSTPPRSWFRLDGPRGAIEGQVMHEPYLELRCEQTGGQPVRPALKNAWFPDGFAGTMGELMCAIESGTEPSISARDNLGTLRLVFDAYADALGD